MRSSRARTEPSMTRSPARSTAPPIRCGSISAVQTHLAVEALSSSAADSLAAAGVHPAARPRSPSRRRRPRASSLHVSNSAGSPAGSPAGGCRPASAGNCGRARPAPAPAMSMQQLRELLGVTCGLPNSASTRGSRHDLAATFQRRRPRRQHAVGARLGEGRLGIGPGDGGLVSHRIRSARPACRADRHASRASISRPSTLEAARDRQPATSRRSSSRARVVSRSIWVWAEATSRAPSALAWPLACSTSSFARSGPDHDLGCAFARLADQGIGLDLRLRQGLLALVGGRQALRDLARALVHGTQDHRPHEPHREPDEDRKDEHLDDERQIEVHPRLLISIAAGLEAHAPLPAFKTPGS